MAVPLSDVASTSEQTPAARLAARLAEELATSWQRGQRPQAEDLLAGHPELAEHPRAAVRLLYEELCQREERGEVVSDQELYTRFPGWRAEIDLLLQAHRLLGLPPATPQFPQTGEVLGEFRLAAELGRGALGRVFLAEQSFLAGRLTVVKVTPRAGSEHLALARLQHTHIVPLYAVRDFPERDLRALCMPCLGGTTLDRALRKLEAIPPARRTGADLRRALAEATADPRMRWPGRGSAWKYLERASYVQAITWIGLCIAEALAHAHASGLVHLDVKPSNVLVTADGVPMLLDFHLARGPVAAGALPDWLGGTPAYMSPEQRAAWAASREGRPAPAAVDGRSDVWSLALVLAEALGGGPAGTDDATAPLAGRDLEHLPLGLRDALARGLRPDRGRYSSAEALAEDLRRHLTDRPLVGVRNRSLRERWAKWRRRQPQALALTGLVLAVMAAALTLVVLALSQARQRTDEAETALRQGMAHLARRDYAEAAAAFERGVARAEGTPGGRALVEQLRHQHRRAARGEAARALHAEVDRLRYHYGDTSLSPKAVQALADRAGKAWAARTDLQDTTGTAPPEAEDEERLRTDLFDAAVLWADLHARPATPAARREALDTLAEAERLFGPGAVLARERQALGGSVTAVPQPRTAWEHYAVGRWLLRTGDLDDAARALDRATSLRPGDFWPWFYSGLCAYRQRRLDEAITAFTACLALAPTSAACYYNRGLALAARGQADRARADYDRALDLDPKLAAAVLNRGALHLQEKRLTEAADDLRRALSVGADPVAVHYNLALVHVARQDRAAARAEVEETLRLRPDHAEAQKLRDRLGPGRPSRD